MNYFDTNLPFHLVKDVNGAGHTIFKIKKNKVTYLFRLFRFFETSYYVKDRSGKKQNGEKRAAQIVTFYNEEQAKNILDRKSKVHGTYKTKECYPDDEFDFNEYNNAWEKDHKSDLDMIKNPYCSSTIGYKAQFYLEEPHEKRFYRAFYFKK